MQPADTHPPEYWTSKARDYERRGLDQLAKFARSRAARAQQKAAGKLR